MIFNSVVFGNVYLLFFAWTLIEGIKIEQHHIISTWSLSNELFLTPCQMTVTDWVLPIPFLSLLSTVGVSFLCFSDAICIKARDQ